MPETVDLSNAKHGFPSTAFSYWVLIDVCTCLGEPRYGDCEITRQVRGWTIRHEVTAHGLHHENHITPIPSGLISWVLWLLGLHVGFVIKPDCRFEGVRLCFS